MRNIGEYIIEKLKISKDVEVENTPDVKAPIIGPDSIDFSKMKYYHNKGSKPQTLVNTIKDSKKLARRFAVAVSMKWENAIDAFGKALVDRGIYSQEQIDKYIEKWHA